ncbi:hypothetical protein F7725_004038, partial [Dissostichus mawsoni]
MEFFILKTSPNSGSSSSTLSHVSDLFDGVHHKNIFGFFGSKVFDVEGSNPQTGGLNLEREKEREYPDSWYQDITSNKKFFSLAATFRGGIVGMIVAEIKGRTKVHKEEHISTTAQDTVRPSICTCSPPTPAIHFYENRDFRQHHYLPYYYSIRGVLKDGFTYRLFRHAQALLRSLLP